MGTGAGGGSIKLMCTCPTVAHPRRSPLTPQATMHGGNRACPGRPGVPTGWSQASSLRAWMKPTGDEKRAKGPRHGHRLHLTEASTF